MLLLVLSDLHLGKGKFLKNGQSNILEDFFEDQRFVEFLDFYSSGDYYDQEVELVLNGDIFNLIQVDVEGVFSHIIDDKYTIKVLEQIYKGHEKFFMGLKRFLERPNKRLTYVIGNHDAGMAFEEVQIYFKSLVGENTSFCFFREINGVHIEHGHRFEAINTVPPKRYFISGPNGKRILNLPWGSLFCILVLPRLKKFRPHIDKIRPLPAYIKWCFIHDFFFFWYLTKTVVKYIIETSNSSYTKQNNNFKTTIKILRQITIFPKYGKMARRILRKKKHLHTIIMGHTHVMEWRRFPEGKYYYNSGTWNAISSIDKGLHDNVFYLSYIYLNVNNKTGEVEKASLNQWQGAWRPFREEVSTS